MIIRLEKTKTYDQRGVQADDATVLPDAETLEEVKKLRTDVTFCSSGLLYM